MNRGAIATAEKQGPCHGAPQPGWGRGGASRHGRGKPSPRSRAGSMKAGSASALPDGIETSSLLTGKDMARGWESKSVESQIESARSEGMKPAKHPVTPEMTATLRKRETLLLARTHLLQQIQASQHPRHLAMLESALAALEKQLAIIDRKSV